MNRHVMGLVVMSLVLAAWVIAPVALGQTASADAAVQPTGPASTAPTAPATAAKAELFASAADLGIPYDRFRTTDRFGREITFYLSPRDPARPVPLVLFIQGSGCTSVFQRAPDGRIGGGIQNHFLQIGRSRVCVLVVEKPHVEFLASPGRPGSAEDCGEAFNAAHTFERWAAALEAALRAALTVPGVDSARVLAAGHSEGAKMAARAAADVAAVTHIAVMSGNGGSQLFDMAELARRGWGSQGGSPPSQSSGGGNTEVEQRRVDEVYRTYEQIRADPENAHRFAWGHAYPRWSSFLAASTLDEVLRSRAAVYIAHGTADQAVPVQSAEHLRAELARRGRPATVDFIAGGDHGLMTPGDEGKGLADACARIVEWFLTGR